MSTVISELSENITRPELSQDTVANVAQQINAIIGNAAQQINAIVADVARQINTLNEITEQVQKNLPITSRDSINELAHPSFIIQGIATTEKPVAQPEQETLLTPLERLRIRIQADEAKREKLREQIGDPVEALERLFGHIPSDIIARNLAEFDNGKYSD